MSYEPHELRPVRTTLQPDVELMVVGQEEENLRLLGVLIRDDVATEAPPADSPTDPSPDLEKAPASRRRAPAA